MPLITERHCFVLFNFSLKAIIISSLAFSCRCYYYFKIDIVLLLEISTIQLKTVPQEKMTGLFSKPTVLVYDLYFFFFFSILQADQTLH